MLERPKFIVMTGPSFAGKSTLAKEIAEKINGDYSSGTQVARDLDIPTSKVRITPEQSNVLVTEHIRRSLTSLNNGKSVVHDSAT